MRDFIEASMLGDGGLRQPSKKVLYKLTQIAEHKDYIDWVQTQLDDVYVRLLYYEKRKDGRNAKPWYILETRTHPLFFEMYSRWYKDKIKFIPKDIKITPMMLAVWIMDDGSYNKPRQEIKLSTNAFTFEDCEVLKEALYRDLNIKSSVRRDSDKKHPVKFPTMYILRKDTRNIAEIVSNYIQPSFMYKIHPNI